MTVTLNLPPEKEAVYKLQVEARGLSLEQWILEVADEHVQPVCPLLSYKKPIPRNGPDNSARGLTAMIEVCLSSRMRP
jgi:hypothetical protein